VLGLSDNRALDTSSGDRSEEISVGIDYELASDRSRRRSPCFDHRGKRNLAALTKPNLCCCQRVGRLINRRVHCFLPEQYDAGQLSLPSPFQWRGAAWRDFAADRDVTRSLSEFRECTGRNSSTCGNIARTPLARGSKPSKRSNGFSQISRLQDLARRSVSVPSSA